MSNFIESIYLVKLNKNFIFFVPGYKENKSLVDKLNLDQLKEKYSNAEILKLKSESSKILDYNLDLFTVNELKLVLAYELNEPAENMFLYCEPSKITSRIVNERKNRKELFDDKGDGNISIGFSFYSEFGTRSLICDFKNGISKGVNSLDTLRDESHYLISSYSPKNNSINLILKSEINQQLEDGKLTQRNVDDIYSLYFPFKNPYKSNEEFKIFMEEKILIIKEFNDNSKLVNLKSLNDNVNLINISNLKYNNLVLSCDTNKRGDFDLESIFKKYNLDDDVIFIRYLDQIKNNYYRVNKPNLFPNIGKYNVSEISIKNSLKKLNQERQSAKSNISKIKAKYASDMPIQKQDIDIIADKERQIKFYDSEIRTYEIQLQKLTNTGNINFTDYENYFVDYIEGKYTPNINKKYLINWKKPIFLEREIEAKDRVKNTEQLELKLQIYQSNSKKYIYITLFITKYGELFLKLTDIQNKFSINASELDEIVDKINICVKKINKIIEGTKLSLLNVSDNCEFTSFNIVNHFLLKEGDTFEKLKSRALLNNIFGFCVENSENTFSYKFLRTNNGYSLDNAKKYFFLLKKNAGQIDVKSLKRLWISEAKRVFNLSSIESLELLETISEEVELEDFKLAEMENLIDVIFTKSDDLDEIIVSMINLSNNNDFDMILKFVSMLLSNKNVSIKASNSPKIKSATTSPAKPALIITTEVKTQNFVNDDNLDIDIDYSDSEDESDEDEDILEPESKPKPEPPSMPQNNLKQTNQVNQNNNNNSKDKILLKDELLDKKKITKSLPTSVREYMINMRKEKDPRLFVFKKSSMFDSYSSKCGAVDMRQPILVNKYEIENMKRNEYSARALEQYKDRLLLWGSSKDNLNFYMCPRIWCIKDNCEITALDFLNNNGKCPICNGEVIDPKDKKIGANKTVMLRKGKSNNYWGDQSVPDDFLLSLPIYSNEYLPKVNELKKSLSKDERKKIESEIKLIENKVNSEQAKSINDYKKLWKQHLNGTEKLAYPSFLKNKTHPEDLCMPCCNANQKIIEDPDEKNLAAKKIFAIKNHDKCINQRIHAYVYFDVNTNITNLLSLLKPGKLIDNMESKDGIKYSKILELNDYVLIINKNKKSAENLLVEVSAEKASIVKEFTDKKIPYINGISFELPEVNKTWISFKKESNEQKSGISKEYFKIVNSIPLRRGVEISLVLMILRIVKQCKYIFKNICKKFKIILIIC